jgi:signal transduction histidine kinase
MSPGKSSLRRRLPIWIALLLAIVVVTFGALSYAEVRRETERMTWVRLRTVADRFAQLSAAGTATRLIQLEALARTPALAAYLKGNGDAAGARAVLQSLGPDTGTALAVGMRRPDGAPVLALRRELPPLQASFYPPDVKAQLSRVYVHEGALAYEVMAPVVERDSLVGRLVVVRGLVAASASLDLLNELVGPGGSLLLGNADGSLWTDFERPVGDVSIEAGNGWFRDASGRRMVHATPIPNTPFLLGVSVPHALVMAPVAGLLWQLAGIGALVVAGGALAGWLLTRRITTPLVQLTAAAEALSAGTKTGEWKAVGGDDEVRRLGDAFAVMASRVTASREQLELEVAERTAELHRAQAELIQREKLAVLGQLASSVGHELRNPLGVMANITYYLTQTLQDVPPKAQQYLVTLRKQVGIAEKIVADILDFTRVREPERETVHLADFISEQLERVTVPPGIVVRHETPPSTPDVVADRCQVGQVFFNVVTNAVQAMEAAGGELRVSAHADNGAVHIEVTDQGPGIPPDCGERIFEPLYTTKLRGIGLGLSVSRTLARANGGDLVVAATGPRGTTFRLELPAARAS